MNTSLVPSINSRLNNLLITATIVVTCAAGAHAIQAAENGIDVRLVSPATMDSQPGKIITLSLKATSLEQENAELVESLQLPENWLSLVSQDRFALPSHGILVRLAAFQIPRECPAGRYTASYVVSGTGNHSMDRKIPVSINVLPTSKLTMLMEDSPDSVVAGDEFKARVRIVNEGNAPVEVELQADSHRKESPATIEPTRISIPAGSSAVAIVSMKTDRRENHMVESLLQIRAISTSDSGKSVSSSLNVVYNIIPRTSGESSLYNSIQTIMEYRSLSLGGSSASQVSWSGEGPLGDSSTDSLSFRIQGTDGQMSKTLGWRDEYRLGYTSKDVSFHLGDHSYGLSYLTDYMHYGRGAAFDFHPVDSKGYGGYYMKPCTDNYAQGVAGAYISRSPWKDTTLKLNMLASSQYSTHHREKVNSQIASVEATAKPLPNLNLHAEYGFCVSDKDPTDTAYRLEASGKFAKKADFYLQTTHAGPDYHGYYQDRDYTMGSVTLPITSRLNASASYSTWKSNMAFRPDLGRSPKEDYAQCNLHYNLRSHWYADLGLGRYHRQDMMSPANFDYIESPVRLSLGNSGKNYTCSLEFRNGDHYDLLSNTANRMQAFRLFASYEPCANQVYTLHLDHSNTHSGGYLFPGGNSVGFSAAIKPSDRFSLVAWWTNYTYADALLNSNQMELSATYLAKDDRTWSLRVQRYYPGSAASDTTVELLYTIPMSLPVSVKRNIGSVTGRVYDSQRDGRPGIANALLYLNGLSSVTDENGYYSFPSLPKGTYSLKVDQKSIGLNRVTEVRTPVAVQVATNSVTKLDLGVIDEVTVSGTVLLAIAPSGIVHPVESPGGLTADSSGGLYTAARVSADSTNDTPTSAAKPTGLENIVLELSNDSETVRRVTDNKGVFSFEDIRPGKWTLKVMKYNLPPNAYLQNPEAQLDLRPGERRDIAINVLPRLRLIKMVGHETVIEDDKDRIRPGG